LPGHTSVQLPHWMHRLWMSSDDLSASNHAVRMVPMPPVYTLPNTCPPTRRNTGQTFRHEAQRMHCIACLNFGSCDISVRRLSIRMMCSCLDVPSVLGTGPLIMET